MIPRQTDGVELVVRVAERTASRASRFSDWFRNCRKIWWLDPSLRLFSKTFFALPAVESQKRRYR